jgi:hypothetical protein
LKLLLKKACLFSLRSTSILDNDFRRSLSRREFNGMMERFDSNERKKQSRRRISEVEKKKRDVSMKRDKEIGIH